MPAYDELSTRMKTFYEEIPKTKLMRRTPVAIRIDGKAFHTFTRGFEKPFDDILIESMQETMKYLCENIQGCVLGYTQSDEITLILVDYKKLNSSAWFDYEVQKMCSVAASMATMAFNRIFAEKSKEYCHCISYDQDGCLSKKEYEQWTVYERAINKGAMFDARCFNIPKEEVANLIYWRQQDASRNSIQMVGHTYFSDAELDKKSTSDIQEMLFSQKGINWNDYPIHQKRGSCCIKTGVTAVGASEENGEVRTWTIERPHWVVDTEIPIFKGEDRDYIEKLIYITEKE